jgi:hypothetical protein
MLRLSISIRRPWPGALVRVIIVIIVYVIMLHLAPAAIIPLSAGGVLGGWLGVGISSARVEPLIV